MIQKLILFRRRSESGESHDRGHVGVDSGSRVGCFRCKVFLLLPLFSSVFSKLVLLEVGKDLRDAL